MISFKYKIKSFASKFSLALQAEALEYQWMVLGSAKFSWKRRYGGRGWVDSYAVSSKFKVKARKLRVTILFGDSITNYLCQGESQGSVQGEPKQAFKSFLRAFLLH